MDEQKHVFIEFMKAAMANKDLSYGGKIHIGLIEDCAKVALAATDEFHAVFHQRSAKREALNPLLKDLKYAIHQLTLHGPTPDVFDLLNEAHHSLKAAINNE